jgi:hypothetical protein
VAHAVAELGEKSGLELTESNKSERLATNLTIFEFPPKLATDKESQSNAARLANLAARGKSFLKQSAKSDVNARKPVLDQIIAAPARL